MRRSLPGFVLAFAFLVSVVAVRAAGQADKLGAGVTLAEATPIADLYAAPEKFVGKTLRIDGVVSAVCTEMGCWMALAPADKPDQTIRFKVDHGTAIVFPISAKGKQASAEGVFEKIAAADHEGNEAAREQTSAQPNASKFGTMYQVKALGAVIK